MAAGLGKIQGIVDSLAGRARRKDVLEDGYKDFPTFFEQLGADGLVQKQRIKEHLASNMWFNCASTVAVVISTTIVGAELDQGSGFALGERAAFFAADVLFTFLFFGEMLVRQNQHGWDFFLDPWNFFDFALVVINCVDVVAAVQTSESGAQVTNTLRVIRLMRLVRHCRGLKPLMGFYLLIQGTVESLKALVWTGVFLSLVTYVLSVVLMTVGDTPEFYANFADSELYFGSVYNTVLTVMQVFTLDSWASDITRPVIRDGNNPIAGAILIAAIVICNWGILNLIIAVMVERMSIMKQEIDLETGKMLSKVEKRVLSSLARDFQKVDTDTDGQLNYDEFVSLIRMPHVAYKLRMLGFPLDETETFFHVLDADRSGQLSPEEFITGLHRIRGLARGADICALIVFAQKHCSRARHNVRIIRRLTEVADTIQERLNDVGRRLHDEIGERADRKKRSEKLWEAAESRANVIGSLDEDRHVCFPSIREEQQ